MPQATEEQRHRMRERFGNIDDAGPAQFLEDAGYVEERFCWKPKPGVETYDDMTEEEYDCLSFLVNEWDWGGFVKGSTQ